MAHAEHPLDRLASIMAQLRGENGCPWDKQQTHRSLLRYLIEEAYEVVDAVERGSMEDLRDELGDLLLQVVFHAQLAKEAGAFNVYDVVASITEKMIRRHPHVFGDAKAETADDVIANWEVIKREERMANGAYASTADEDAPAASRLDGISPHLPALLYADEVSRRAAKVGFDWADADAVLEKMREELAELQELLRLAGETVGSQGSAADHMQARIAEEWGDLVFTLVNLGRHLHIQPELAARQAARKFEKRFRTLERKAAEQGSSLEHMTPDEMNALWDEIKDSEQS